MPVLGCSNFGKEFDKSRWAFILNLKDNNFEAENNLDQENLSIATLVGEKNSSFYLPSHIINLHCTWK